VASELGGHPVLPYMKERARSTGGLDFTTRIDDYEGIETHCSVNSGCPSRTISLSTAKGYDNMTGLGTPTSGFVPALAKF